MQPPASKLHRPEIFVDASTPNEGCLVDADELRHKRLKAHGEGLSEELANCVD